MSTPNPFKAGTGKARLLDALRRGDVDAYLFAPVVGSKLAFDGHKSIGRLAPRVLELRKLGYGIDDVATPDVGHSIYRLVSEPQSSPSPTVVPQASDEANGADGAGTGHPAPVAHVGIHLDLDDLKPCPPAWQRSGLNPYEYDEEAA